MPRTLNTLKPGESGVVYAVKGKGALKRRFMDMGIIKGTNIVVERLAPLGDPVEIKLKGYSLTLRKKDAEIIFVE